MIITTQVSTASFMQQCDLFSLDSHHVPSAKNYFFSRHTFLQLKPP